MKIDFRRFDIRRLSIFAFTFVALAGLWGMVFWAWVEEERRMKEYVEVHPGVESYGTHSEVTFPSNPAQSSSKQAIPMVSGSTVREMAHSGHATQQKGATAKELFTTSSAKVKTVGGGMGSSFGLTSGKTSSSSRGIMYGSTSATMPMYAMSRTSSHHDISTRVAENVYSPARARRAKPNTDGEDGDWSDDGAGDGKWWYFDEDHWRQPNDGETRFDFDLGYVVIWNGSTWVKQTEYEPGVPVGDAPWLLFLLLIGLYGMRQYKRTTAKS